jgi:hypothetical protein
MNQSIYDIPNIRDMLAAHLGEGKTVSEFTSWAASFTAAVGFGRATARGERFFVAIVDTHKLPQNVAAYHCPELLRAGLTGAPFPEEYLIHGVADGHAFAAIEYHDKLPGPWFQYLGGGAPYAAPTPGLKAMREAKTVALQFQEGLLKRHPNRSKYQLNELTLVACIGLLSLLPSFYNNGSDKSMPYLEQIERILREVPSIQVPESFKNEASIMTNAVNVTNFPELKWMILVGKLFFSNPPAFCSTRSLRMSPFWCSSAGRES